MTSENNIQELRFHQQAKKYPTSRLTLCEAPNFVAHDAPRTANGKPSAEKVKARKRERNDRLIAALINSIGRIFAQIIGAVAGVVLGIVIAGHMSGTQNGYQVSQNLPVVPAASQHLSQPLEYVGRIPDKSQALPVMEGAAPEALHQQSITARWLVIFKTSTGEFIVYLEPAEPHP